MMWWQQAKQDSPDKKENAMERKDIIRVTVTQGELKTLLHDRVMSKYPTLDSAKVVIDPTGILTPIVSFFIEADVTKENEKNITL